MYIIHNESIRCADLDPSNRARYREREMNIWLKLVPKLHLSGAEHTQPGHNIFHETADPETGASQLQRLQFNRAFESQQLTTGRHPGSQLPHLTIVLVKCLN